jgi:PadR family transcriptional regulator AphA
MQASPNPPSRMRLSTASYAVLALVERARRVTPYELKVLAERLGVAAAWPLRHTQVYSCCRALAESRALEEHVETTGRRRRFYTITPLGRTLLAAWRAAPVAESTVTHDPGLLQLCCGVPVPEIARARTAVHRRAVREFEQRRSALVSETDPALALMWDAALARERFWLAFWEHRSPNADSRGHGDSEAA